MEKTFKGTRRGTVVGHRADPSCPTTVREVLCRKPVRANVVTVMLNVAFTPGYGPGLGPTLSRHEGQVSVPWSTHTTLSDEGLFPTCVGLGRVFKNPLKNRRACHPCHLLKKEGDNSTHDEPNAVDVPDDVVPRCGSSGHHGMTGTPLSSDGSCLLYTSPSPRDGLLSRMPSSA